MIPRSKRMNIQGRQRRSRKSLLLWAVGCALILILVMMTFSRWLNVALAPVDESPPPLREDLVASAEPLGPVPPTAEQAAQYATLERERSYYADADKAELVMGEDWALIPSEVDPGDVLLIRHNAPGEVAWQGKKYTLKPLGSGYYTYVPIPIQLKPGEYGIGGATVTVRTKSFPTDRLTVSEQLESIKQNTERINADQKKIDKARSQSAGEFLFPPDSLFIEPVQGRLSTPFGYTRYVNGKYDGSHKAIDIAAPMGTPVKASNDGVVVLAET
ncbi:MAG: family metallopeptidase, partial [Paenibacillaceae bacterium]|nr:family metallopeptidase [Paenibacillaceae bacterium]